MASNRSKRGAYRTPVHRRRTLPPPPSWSLRRVPLSLYERDIAILDRQWFFHPHRPMGRIPNE